MAFIHTVKDDRRKIMKRKKGENEVWSYEVDEPHEHDPWLFPQLIGGYRADHISGVSQSISQITTTSIDEQVIGDTRETVHEPVSEEILVTTQEEKETQTSPEAVARVEITDAPEEVIVTTEEVFEAPQQMVETTEEYYEAPQQMVETTEEVTEIPEQTTIETTDEYFEAPQQMMETTVEVSQTPEHITEITDEFVEAPEQVIETTVEAIEAPEPRKVFVAPQTEEVIEKVDEELVVDEVPAQHQTETVKESEEITTESLGENESPHESVTESEYFTASESVSTSDEEANTTSKIRKLDKEGDLDYVIYYQRKPLIKPVGVLHGRVEGQIFLHESVKFEYGEFYGQIFLRIADTNDKNAIKDMEFVNNSEDKIKISPTGEATALIYGEKFGGYIIGSGSTVTVVGNLTLRTGEKLANIKVISGGAYLVTIINGMQKFVIHENTTALLDFGESYRIDGGRETINERKQIDLPQPKPVDEETQTDLIKKIDGETQTELRSRVSDETRIKLRVEEKSTQTEKRPSFVSTHVITYVLYYHYPSKSDKDKAVAVLSGTLLGQTNSGCEQASHMNIPHIEGKLVMVLLDNYDTHAMKDSAIVKHSKDIVKICPRDNGKACIYGQTGAGFVIGSESIVVISGRLLIAANNTTRTLTPGRHFVELYSGFTKFIICANGLCILVHSSGSYKIDDRSYLGSARDLPVIRKTIVDTRGIDDDSTHESVSESESETVSESVTDSETESGGKVDKSTQTETQPSFRSSSVVSYIIYERQNSKPDTAVAVLMGQVLSQTNTECEHAKQANIPRTDGQIVMALLDNHDIQLMRQSVYVMHCNDILKICPIGDAKACVYGRNGRGFVFGSDSILIVSGQLKIAQNGSYRALSPGRHLIEPYSGTTSFIICVIDGKTLCFLVESNGQYKIDDESYLDAIKPAIRRTTARISDTVRESETIGSTKPFGDQISRVSTATQTESILPSLVPSQIVSYVLYYHHRSNPDKPVAVLLGQVFGQTNSECNESKHMNVPRVEGKLVMVLLESSDIHLMKDSAIVQHSNDIIKICPRDDAKACIYGQTGSGFVITSEAILIISGRLLLTENNSSKTLSPGTHLVEPRSGVTKFIICTNGLCILVHTTGVYKIDDH